MSSGLPNPHLASLESDFLYHIGYSSHDCKDLFKDVKVTQLPNTIILTDRVNRFRTEKLLVE